MTRNEWFARGLDNREAPRILTQEDLAVFRFRFGAGGRKGGATNKASGHIQKIGTNAGRRKACASRMRNHPEYLIKMRAARNPEERRQTARRVGEQNATNGHLHRIRTSESCAKGGRRGGQTNIKSGHLANLSLQRFLKTVAWG